MPRYKPVHKGLKLLPVDFDKQIQPGSFEFALCYLIDHELDLSAFHARYKNDYEGAPGIKGARLNFLRYTWFSSDCLARWLNAFSQGDSQWA